MDDQLYRLMADQAQEEHMVPKTALPAVEATRGPVTMAIPIRLAIAA